VVKPPLAQASRRRLPPLAAVPSPPAAKVWLQIPHAHTEPPPLPCKLLALSPPPHPPSPAASVTSARPTQVGGGFHRWLLCHHLQLLERAVKRLPGSAENDAGAANCMNQASPSWHVLNPHLEWILPTLLQMTANIHWLSTPQVPYVPSPPRFPP